MNAEPPLTTAAADTAAEVATAAAGYLPARARERVTAISVKSAAAAAAAAAQQHIEETSERVHVSGLPAEIEVHRQPLESDSARVYCPTPQQVRENKEQKYNTFYVTYADDLFQRPRRARIPPACQILLHGGCQHRGKSQKPTTVPLQG